MWVRPVNLGVSLLEEVGQHRSADLWVPTMVQGGGRTLSEVRACRVGPVYLSRVCRCMYVFGCRKQPPPQPPDTVSPSLGPRAASSLASHSLIPLPEASLGQSTACTTASLVTRSKCELPAAESG